MSTPARHSGGPRTPEGKDRSRMNALSHGGRASKLIAQIAGEERFDQLRREIIEECRPVGPREEALVDQMAQCALQSEFTGAQLRAAVRDAARTCEQFVADGSPEAEDKVLRMSVEVPAVALVSRYNASAMSGFFRAHAQLRVLQGERLSQSAAVVGEAAVESLPGRDSSAIERLREILSDAAARQQFLRELHCGQGTSLTAEGESSAPLDPDALATALEDTFLAKTGLEQQVALLFAAEYLFSPDAPVSALCKRAGLHRRETALKLRDRLAQPGEATRDWVLRGLEAYLNSR